MVADADHGVADDLVDVAGSQEDGFAGVERLGGLVLPQPVVPAFDIVEAEMAVAVRVDQVGGEGQIVRARRPGLFRLAQRVLRRRSVITTHPSLSALLPGLQLPPSPAPPSATSIRGIEARPVKHRRAFHP
ncbi:hypothetical protein AB0P40_02270 [Streptomyces sp. NPDC079189]|uniref:hypothetical protein n=1 Tax=Streptomyces sp. NPDC079189 TaxID=3154514 RepID=UPI00342BF2EE